MYDAIVVGARCAGSPTAMLLARKGYRVLLLGTRGLECSSGFTSTERPELRFRALLTEGDAKVLFHRNASDQIGGRLT